MTEALHTAAENMWSYACECIRCQWEQWWNEADDSVCPMPNEAHPDGEYLSYFHDRAFWKEHGHHPRS